MKILNFILSMALVLFTGCATTQNQTTTDTQKVNADRTAAIVRASAQIGTYYAIREDKNAAAYFDAATVALGVLLDQGQYDPGQLQNTLTNISVKELRSEVVSLAIGAALNLYGAYFGEVTTAKLDQASVYVRPVLQGLRQGILAGLNSNQTEKSFGIARK